MLGFAPLAWFYFGIWLTFAAAPAVASLKPEPIFGAVVMGASWFASNEAVRVFGYPGFILPTALADAVLAVAVASVGTIARPRMLAAVFVLFLMEEVCHMAFVGLLRLNALIVTHGQMLLYVGVLNAIFFAQCLAVGLACVRARLVDSRSDHRRHRPDPRRSWLGVGTEGLDRTEG